jgi:hypothetical protein
MTQNNSEVDTILRGAELRLRRLSLDRLRVADDFLSYLEEKEADASTRELLGLAGFEDRYRGIYVSGWMRVLKRSGVRCKAWNITQLPFVTQD